MIIGDRKKRRIMEEISQPSSRCTFKTFFDYNFYHTLRLIFISKLKKIVLHSFISWKWCSLVSFAYLFFSLKKYHAYSFVTHALSFNLDIEMLLTASPYMNPFDLLGIRVSLEFLTQSNIKMNRTKVSGSEYFHDTHIHTHPCYTKKWIQ